MRQPERAPALRVKGCTINRIRLLLSSILVALVLAACSTGGGPSVPAVSIGSEALEGGQAGEQYEYIFSASGLPADVGEVTFVWSMGDTTAGEREATVSNGVAVTVTNHTFSAAGDYEVTVSVRTGDGVVLATRTATVTMAVPENWYDDPVSYVVGESPHSVVVADLNNDGHLDIVVALSNNDAVGILWGAGARQAPQLDHLPTPVNPKHVALADFNGDGCLDIAVAVQDAVPGGQVDGEDVGVVTVYLSEGASCGVFGVRVDYEACGRPHQVAAGSFNDDGFMDIVVACWSRNELAILPGSADGQFGAAILVDSGGGNPHAVVVDDFNSDGRDDIAVAALGTSRATVLLATDEYDFAAPALYVTGSSPHGIRVADLNDDGYPDIATVNQASDDLSIFLNNGNGTFRSLLRYEVGDMPKDLAFGDLNGDGFLDIVVVNSHGNHPVGTAPTDITVLYGTGDGRLSGSETIRLDLTPFSVAMVDLDADGNLDIVTANWGSGDVKVLYNRGLFAGGPGGPTP